MATTRWHDRGDSEARQDERDGNLPREWTDEVRDALYEHCREDIEASAQETARLTERDVRFVAQEYFEALAAGYRALVEERATEAHQREREAVETADRADLKTRECFRCGGLGEGREP